MRSLSMLILVAACFLLASCGGGEGKSDEDQIRQTVSDYTKAISGKNPSKLCDVLITRKIADASKKDRDKQLDSCRSRIKKQDFSKVPKAQKVEVKNVKVKGSKATAKVATGSGKQRSSSRISFRRVDDHWRILAGS
jgi:hypothetical protein